MPSVVDIWNLALSRVGVSQRVQSTTENSAQADACGSAWDQVRQEVLYEGFWRFAARAVALALVSDQSTLAPSALIYPGYRYVYQKPADALKVQAVTTSSGLRTFPYLAYWWERTYPILGPYRPQWQEIEQVAADGTASGTYIVTDQDSAWGIYTSDVQNVAVWDPKFRSAVAWKLGVEVSGTLKVAASVKADAESHYQAELNAALAQDLNERQPDDYPESPAILARG